MAYTCNFCGTYVTGMKCPTCERNELLRKSVEQQREFAEQQNELMEKNAKTAAYEARMNREMQEELAERAERKERAAQREAELEELVKTIFADIAILIQTNTTKTVGEKVEGFCSRANAVFEENQQPEFAEMGGVFTPQFAKVFRKIFSDYILNNPAKAAEIAIARSIFESKAKIAKEKFDAYEEREEQKKKAERIAREAKEEEERKVYAAVVDLEKKKKARYVSFLFVLLGVVLSYIEFSNGNFIRGLLSVLGVIFFGFCAWALRPNVTQDDIDSVVSGFVKGLNR